MQITVVFRQTKLRLILIVRWQQHTKIIITYIRGKIISHNTFDALIFLTIKNRGLQNFNSWESFTFAFYINIHRDNIKFDSVAICIWIVARRQGIEAVIDHFDGVAQILLTTFTSCQVGKVGGQTCIVRRTIVFIKADALDRKCKFLARFMSHDDVAP